MLVLAGWIWGSCITGASAIFLASICARFLATGWARVKVSRETTVTPLGTRWLT
jgi:hypothetical protein